MNEPGLYLVRPVVEAIRYDPPQNCEAVWQFLKWPWPQGDLESATAYHDDEECDDTVPIYIDTPQGVVEVSPGEWVVRDVTGYYGVGHANFQRIYTELP